MKNVVQKTYLKQNLYVRGLPDSLIRDDELKKYFEKFGKVKNAKVYVYDTDEKDPIGNPIFKGKGYGFVCFESQTAALKASKADPTDLILSDKPLEVFFFEPKQQRAKKLNELKAQQDNILTSNPFLKLMPNLGLINPAMRLPFAPKQ